MREVHPTGERIYLAVKEQVLGGTFRPGERIDAAELAEHHAASITPVRAALHRLVGEHLVEAQPSEGFHAPRVTELSLRDLYTWSALVLQLAWRLCSQVEAPSPSRGAQPDTWAGDSAQTVAATACLFAALGERSGNEQCAGAVNALNDRLHAARLMETRLFADGAAEVAALSGLIAGGRSTNVRRAITIYHRRRLRSAAAIVRLLHRPSALRTQL